MKRKTLRFGFCAAQITRLISDQEAQSLFPSRSIFLSFYAIRTFPPSHSGQTGATPLTLQFILKKYPAKSSYISPQNIVVAVSQEFLLTDIGLNEMKCHKKKLYKIILLAMMQQAAQRQTILRPKGQPLPPSGSPSRMRGRIPMEACNDASKANPDRGKKTANPPTPIPYQWVL